MVCCSLLRANCGTVETIASEIHDCVEERRICFETPVDVIPSSSAISPHPELLGSGQ